MNKPILTRIANQIDTTLRTIKTPEYQVTLDVQRVDDDAQEPKDATAVLIYQDAQSRDDANKGGSREHDPIVQWEQVFHVILFARRARGDDLLLDEKLAIYAAEVEKALRSADPTWGGLALRSWTDPTEWVFDHLPRFAVVPIIVHYATMRGDPYSLPTNEL